MFDKRKLNCWLLLKDDYIMLFFIGVVGGVGVGGVGGLFFFR